MEHDSDKDRQSADHIEKQMEKAQTVISAEEDVVEYDEAEGKRIIRRIDTRLLVTIGFMYCVSLIDRTNISAAALAGLVVDLKLDGVKYVSPFLPGLPYTDMYYDYDADMVCSLL